MNPETKEILYNELNILLDMMNNEVAKEYLKDIIFL
jgi:hypothetical protein